MLLALEKLLVPASGVPQSSLAGETESRLNVSVVYTSVAPTLAALKKAGELANQLGGHITLLVPQIVPYPLPLTSPPIILDWNERRFRVIASESPVETMVRLYLCRDRLGTLVSALKPQSVVVIGGRTRWWWPTSEETLAKALRRAGHEVILTETE